MEVVGDGKWKIDGDFHSWDESFVSEGGRGW